MHALIKTLTCSLLLSTFLISQTEAIELTLSDKDIENAIAYGTGGRDLTHPELLKVWRVDLGYGIGAATIVTPFGSLVVLAKEKANRFLEPTEREIKETLDKDRGKLAFGCSLYGEDAWFADKYKAVLMYKDKKITPSKVEIPPSANYTRSYPNSPRYWALCFFKFDIADIDPNAKVTLILNDGKELKFPFDLEKLK